MSKHRKVSRVATPNIEATEVLIRSRRRCCLCYYWDNDFNLKKGQLAHVDRDSSHSEADNLAYLCLPHHNEYDSTHRQSKNITPDELRAARSKLYEKIACVHDPDTRVRITIELDRDFSTFDDAAKDEVLRVIRSALTIEADIRVVGIREGSVLLTLETNIADALRIFDAAKGDLLGQVGAVDAALESLLAPTPDGSHPIDDRLVVCGKMLEASGATADIRLELMDETVILVTIANRSHAFTATHVTATIEIETEFGKPLEGIEHYPDEIQFGSIPPKKAVTKEVLIRSEQAAVGEYRIRIHAFAKDQNAIYNDNPEDSDDSNSKDGMEFGIFVGNC